MVRAVEAGIDLMEHAEFLDPDNQLGFGPGGKNGGIRYMDQPDVAGLDELSAYSGIDPTA